MQFHYLQYSKNTTDFSRSRRGEVLQRDIQPARQSRQESGEEPRHQLCDDGC